MRATSHRSFIESLEGRQLLSVSVSFSAGTVTVTGDSVGNRVQILDAGATSSVSVDVNRNGLYSDRVDIRRSYSDVTRYSLDLRGGNDYVDAHTTEVISGLSKTFVMRGGDGNDTFNFATSPSLGLRNSSLVFNVGMSTGADRVSLQLDDVVGSTVSGTISAGSGDDVVKTGADYDIRSSSVDLAISLGAGRDSYRESHDLEGFDLFGADSLWRTRVSGGDGNDSMVSELFGPRSGVSVEGTFSNEFLGDAGTDTVQEAALP